jgi:P27 family predicted phage terminase small subunit
MVTIRDGRASRGPLPQANSERGRARAAKAARSTALMVVRGRAVAGARPDEAPEAPADLGETGLAVWRECWACEWSHRQDRSAIEHLCRLEDERAELLAAVEAAGLLLSKPVVTPRGDVVGEELYANPLLRELRRLDGPIVTLRDRLGVAPMARARLGQAVVELRRGESALAKLLDDRGPHRTAIKILPD